MQDKSYELVKGVRVTNADDIDWNHGVRMDMSKYKQFKRDWHAKSYADQEVRDKISKNNGWSVCSSWSSPKDKTMTFTIQVNADLANTVVVNYDDICKSFGWKSFKWSDDGQVIFMKK